MGRPIKSVFVTGGTGFIGRRLLERLARAGVRAKVLVRPGSSDAEVSRRGFATVRGNVWEPGPWTDEVRGVDAVVHLVGIIQPYRANTFERVHVKGAETVARAARAAGVKKLVHMSALGTRADAVSAYHKSKWKAEELARGAGVPFTILRPSIVYGDSPFIDLLKLLSMVPLVTPVAGPGTNKMQPVWVDDVARCLEASLADERTDGRTFGLGGPEVYTFDQMLDVVREAMGKGPRLKLHMPVPLLRVQAAVMEAVLPRPPVTRDQLIMLGEDNVADMAAARSLFGNDWRSFREWAQAEL